MDLFLFSFLAKLYMVIIIHVDSHRYTHMSAIDGSRIGYLLYVQFIGLSQTVQVDAVG